MRWLIRTITRKRKGSIAHTDETYGKEVLSIGRGAGQGLFLSDLRVALEHARITPLKAGRFRVESLIASGVRVDGKLQQTAGAGIGSRIEIGTSLIRLIKPPKGYDAAVEVSELTGSGASRAGMFAGRPFSLAQTRLSKRRVSWLLFGLVLVVALLVPLGAHFVPGLAERLRATPLPDDGQWQAGTLQAAHHFFGEDCSTCHTHAFARVKDEACTTCHAATAAHADPAKFDLAELTGTRCASCHKDHNGLRGLIRQDQALCADCHRDLIARAPETVLDNVADFSANHPEFKVELAAWDGDGNYWPRREPLNSDVLSEDSNLKFPHDKHLDPAGVNAPAGTRVLDCGSCHRVEPGGGKMLPVAFESMCQDCHTLGFDLQSPERQVPHGKVAEVLFMLEEYYANRALEGGYADVTAPSVVRQRRRPGTRLSRAETQEALAWARSKSRRVGEDLFEGRACSVCHRVERQGTVEAASWRVRPVRVAGVWFEKAAFSHGSHTTMPCESCHGARESSASDDVLIPGIANCRACHGGETARRKVASTCITCHRYHVFDGALLAESAR